MIRLRLDQLVALALFPVMLLLHVGEARPVDHSREVAQARANVAAVLRWDGVALDDLSRRLDGVSADDTATHATLDDMTRQRDSLADQLKAGLGSGPRVTQAVVTSGGGGSFPWGYCTWYVATRRNVTWNGDAINWWGNAQGIRPEGQQPTVGAIMVSREGDWRGHVAYVEAVLDAWTFVVTEANYTAWGVVDRRTVDRRKVAVVGFIY